MISGDAYHGKSTLLRPIIDGIYDHVKGNGRELVISSPDSCLVRAEDGRVISHVDMSFMKNLPDGTLTSDFSTLYASGSTSMAAAITECIETGSKHILLDEDISATNLLYKDNIMERILINRSHNNSEEDHKITEQKTWSIDCCGYKRLLLIFELLRHDFTHAQIHFRGSEA